MSHPSCTVPGIAMYGTPFYVWQHNSADLIYSGATRVFISGATRVFIYDPAAKTTDSRRTFLPCDIRTDGNDGGTHKARNYYRTRGGAIAPRGLFSGGQPPEPPVKTLPCCATKCHMYSMPQCDAAAQHGAQPLDSGCPRDALTPPTSISCTCNNATCIMPQCGTAARRGAQPLDSGCTCCAYSSSPPSLLYL